VVPELAKATLLAKITEAELVLVVTAADNVTVVLVTAVTIAPAGMLALVADIPTTTPVVEPNVKTFGAFTAALVVKLVPLTTTVAPEARDAVNGLESVMFNELINTTVVLAGIPVPVITLPTAIPVTEVEIGNTLTGAVAGLEADVSVTELAATGRNDFLKALGKYILVLFWGYKKIILRIRVCILYYL